MGASWTRSAVFIALLAYNLRGLRDMARSSAQAFLAPLSFGAEPESGAPLSATALTAHTRLRFVADMHASPLMSARDVLIRSKPRCSWRKCSRSHVDLPRLVDGHVAVQFFSGASSSAFASLSTQRLRGNAVFPSLPNTATTGLSCPQRSASASLFGQLCGTHPSAGNVTSAAATSDAALPLALLSGAAPGAARSAAGRVEAALARTWAAASGSAGKLQVITSLDELELYVVQRFLCAGTPRGCPYSAALLAVEGAEVLAHAGVEELEAAATALFERGVRSLALHHAADNAAGGARGGSGQGLTAWGAALVQTLEALGVAVDLSHSSDAVIEDVLAIAVKPLSLTHVVPASSADACAAAGGVLGGSAPGPPVAVVPDVLLARVAAQGGVVGVSAAACVRADESAAMGDVAQRVVRLAARIGATHVAIGSDWDGGVVIPAGLDARGLPLLTSALGAFGLPVQDLDDVMGGSVLRLLRATLPSELSMAEHAARGVSANRHTEMGENGINFDVWM